MPTDIDTHITRVLEAVEANKNLMADHAVGSRQDYIHNLECIGEAFPAFLALLRYQAEGGKIECERPERRAKVTYGLILENGKRMWSHGYGAVAEKWEYERRTYPWPALPCGTCNHCRLNQAMGRDGG